MDDDDDDDTDTDSNYDMKICVHSHKSTIPETFKMSQSHRTKLEFC